jgi:anaerobic selenocysteine-containing dehydrogenase
MSDRHTHFRTCHLCEAMCGIAIEVDGDKILSIRGDDADPFSRGHICPKAPALADVHNDPDRLRRPLVKRAGGFVEVGWDEALAEAATRLHDVQTRHGANAVATYLGNPSVHNHGPALFAPMLVRTLHTKNRYSATSVDQLPHQLAAYFMLGHQFLFPIPDIDRTGHMVIFGGNPLASMGSLMTAPGVKARLAAIQARGGRVVVVDPRRTETAEVADEHVFVRPGTDALVLLAMVHVILAERSPRLGRLEPLVRGLDRLRAVVAEWDPERVAAPTGVPADTIRRLALELHDAHPAVCYGRVGTSTQAFGALCQWLINTINVITGNFDSPGGVMFTTPAVDALAAAAGLGIPRGSYGRWKSRVRGFPEAGGELPVATLAEDILTPGDGQIRALVTVAGNPVLSTPNGAQMDEALASLELVVAIDPYVNETTRHAHIILPPVSPLERSHYDAALHVVAVHNTAKWSPALFAPPPGAMADWEILLGLKGRLEALRGSSLRDRATNALLRRLGPDGLINVGLRLGPHGLRKGARGLSLARLAREPHGVDLGPLEPRLPGRLPADHRYIDVAPDRLVGDVARLAARVAGHAPNGKLLLVGRRHLRSNNSWMHNVPKLVAGKPRCTLLLHPTDAERLGLRDADVAVVTSRVGSVRVPVEVSHDIMPGVVSLPHGFGHGRAGVRLSVAARPENAGVSVNDLTDDRFIDELAGTAALSGVPVEVVRA